MMARTCSKCGKMGHNSRTCSSTTMQYYWTQLLKMKERGGDSFRLFGVQLDHHDLSSSPSSFSLISSDTINRQRWSMDLSSSTALRLTSCLPGYEANISINGYRYQGGLQETNYTQGVAWTEEEHRRFLEGIEKLGKGDWMGISKNYVTTRSPTQIASHAQKYFLRLQNTTTVMATIDNLDPNRKRCRCPSLFDVGKDQPVSAHEMININTYNPNVEASVNNPYECWPADHHSKPLWFDVNSMNLSFKSAVAAAGGEPDLELKLAAI